MRVSILTPILIILAIASLFIGVNSMSLVGLLNGQSEQLHVLLISRIPRLISILIAGISMSIVGLIMQQLTRNKFVSPSTSGTMESATLGILVAIILFGSASMLQKMTISFAFSLAGTFAFMRILDRIKFRDTIFIPLVGIMFGGIISSITTFFAYKYDLIQSVSAWFQGSFTGVMKGRYELLYISIIPAILAYIYANRFTIAGMGEDLSSNLGLNYKKIVSIGLVIVALVTSVVVITVGMIPFIGLIIPNIVSIYRGDHLQKNLPLTALLGAIFMLACDILGRLIIYPYELPIGLVVGVVGGIIFLFLLLRRNAYEA